MQAYYEEEWRHFHSCYQHTARDGLCRLSTPCTVAKQAVTPQTFPCVELNNVQSEGITIKVLMSILVKPLHNGSLD